MTRSAGPPVGVEPHDFGDIAAGGHDLGRDAAGRVRAILRLIEPRDAIGVRKVRLGNPHDGGYVMLDDFDGIAAAYSLGISDDVSWDRDVAARGIDVFQYDHTVEGPPEGDARFRFHRIGIAGEDSADGAFRSLPSLLRENGHRDGGDLLLKCDIETAEWQALAALSPDELQLFRQIVVEVHGLRDLHQPAFAALAEPVFAVLAASHAVVHVHGNNHAACAVTAGVPVPTVLELTYVRREGKRFARPRRPFPGPLDRPNNPAAADHALGFFRF